MIEPTLDWAAAGSPCAGEIESGDAFLVLPFSKGTLVAVVDGLGHGSEAADAARRALAVVAEHPDEGVVALGKRCHLRLRGTRGVAMGLASLDATTGRLAWVGIGDVHGVLVRAEPSAVPIHLLPRPGIVGSTLPAALEATVVSVEVGDRIVIATDGARMRTSDAAARTREPLDRTAARVLGARDRLDDDALVVVASWRRTARPARLS